eukprot:CAMPEP_0202958184 /NCGR_PEP_ID=MMETSP1396-20130829/2546_1 /ASSEMBLY_ACC=CAM_ASM_000872 /TAXON_ID= /ORGANISM="Pseudokeronopsis sp., Strain Brazil" /LENGTH=43 /DNA_ID= /DNA_START= /DNA_END= /DNA_ORIENTATION=
MDRVKAFRDIAKKRDLELNRAGTVKLTKEDYAKYEIEESNGLE